MLEGRVIGHRLPCLPGKDSVLTIRKNWGESGNPWWVHYQPPGGGKPIPADDAHAKLVDAVNAVKQQQGNPSGGSFSLNEHGQLIVRTRAGPGHGGKTVHLIAVTRGRVFKYTAPIRFQKGSLDPTVTPAEGELWPGPLCGLTYKFAAPDNHQPPSRNLDEIFVPIEGITRQLSTEASIRQYPPTTGPLAIFLRAIRRRLPRGGRFRVNQHGRAFTSNANLFIGCIPIDQWFPPLTARS